MNKPKFKVGDRVTYTNDYGMCWGTKTITEVDIDSSAICTTSSQPTLPGCTTGVTRMIRWHQNLKERAVQMQSISSPVNELTYQF